MSQSAASPARPGGAPIRHGSLAAALLCTAVVAGCGGGTGNGSASLHAGLERYLAQVEPIRLAVNRLLDRADPILRASNEHRLTPAQAARKLHALERRFARFTVNVAAIEPRIPALASLHAGYAHTYVLEDAYLSALDAGLADGSVSDLPHTQSAQRAAIIAWRTELMVLAREAAVTLPSDLQQAGRGEIAPSPKGS